MGYIIPNMGTPIDHCSMSEALFSNVQQRVLSLIFGHPERSYYTSEIVKIVEKASHSTE